MAQVISRAQLTWLGEPGPLFSTRKAFTVVCVLVGAYFFYSCALSLASMPYTPSTTPPLLTILKFLGIFLFTAYSVFSLCRTRETIRARYRIPETVCVGCEDLCCAVWCSCCTTAQLLRHTGEYETHPGACCTKTGHVAGTPVMV